MTHDQVLARVRAELPESKHPAAFAFLTAFQHRTDVSGRHPLSWMSGDGSSGYLGPTVLCESLSAAYAATVILQQHGAGPCRWLRDVTGWHVLPAALFPNLV